METTAKKTVLVNPNAHLVRTDAARREAIRGLLAGMSKSVIRNVYSS